MINNIIEKIPISIYEDVLSASKLVAKEIADLIRRRTAENKKTVLGLATGSSPVKVYDELVRLHKEENLSFKNVITFNLDEYYPIAPDNPESYMYFMREHLFDHVDIDMKNVHIPCGTLKENQINDFCNQYEIDIEDAGGIDVQILGIGRTGHIGFNEPGSQIFSKTRKITLNIITKTDAAPAFNGVENVPTDAITMGIGTILKARRIILLAWGDNKSDIIKQTVEGEISDFVPATFLQRHPNVNFVLDKAAASKLSRVNYPWLFEECKWNSRLIRKAVVWLCMKLDKPILKLTDRDYIDHGMSELLSMFNSYYDLNIKMFNELQHTITGWPGGKPNADDSQRPERAVPYPKKVIVFSPHPDDDVISMGGTLARLVKQGHDVHVAYQTSGNIAVFDDDLLKYIDFISNASAKLNISDDTKSIVKNILADINNKTGQKDSKNVAYLKGMIRKSEATSACRFIGLPDNKVHFLQMPFYESGSEKKNDLSDADIKLIVNLLREVKPHQIYAAGDLSDPHGTHKICFDAILKALDMVKNEEWFKDCYLWMYRGAWQEWELCEVDMAVPLSPDEVTVKRKAIFKHQTQKDVMPFPGSDSREFWQRAEERNHATAILYDKIGLAEYQAIELFVRYRFE
ncbi:MAG: glucosamine-6-phosphate deaminase [Bacteroidales bacterium]|jgi:glucosamine-6-phosphate deaminase|nr:glucosamine-6-phosphate deaminase [Bacteroidales bacterium]MDD3152626.1 glucosamine-6-phosphate deaminase [Bacteroidales bacterium]MDD3914197.1 glucosamine-6-phosphate deaminase [Bacteroidales bacterium]MDD4634632.1 glucosamine-6-phosphate deaminase [Bacteroidales bacterium]